MNALKLVAVAACIVASTTAFAGEPSPADPARQYVDDFLKGDMQPLLDHASPELRQLMKDDQAMQKIRAGTVGDHPQLADEQIAVTYKRLVKSANGQTWAVTATVAPSGELAGFLIAPAGEAPSTYLDYKTKADLRLPFDGNWTVFWGGRTVKENYHAAYPDQRFAYDIVMMNSGSTHSGDGSKCEDYYCYGHPIVSPSAGVVVEATDDLADNTPGKMDPAHPPGNHVILDLGNDEYLFLAHLQKGSVKVKPGDHVKPGDVLGLCGNTGNTSEPHLHVHLQTTPRYGDGKGLPLQFQNYLADGKPVDRGEPTKGLTISTAPAK
jgi:hypothetical protein